MIIGFLGFIFKNYWVSKGLPPNFIIEVNGEGKYRFKNFDDCIIRYGPVFTFKAWAIKSAWWYHNRLIKKEKKHSWEKVEL